MSELYFVDTNVFVYRRDLRAGEKQARADAWLGYLWRARAGRISTQVLSELYVTLTQKLSPGLPPPAAREEIADLASWDPLSLSYSVIERAFDVQRRFQLSYRDSLIAAAAQLSSSAYLLSEDLQDGLDLDGPVVRNPFLHAPPH